MQEVGFVRENVSRARKSLSKVLKDFAKFVEEGVEWTLRDAIGDALEELGLRFRFPYPLPPDVPTMSLDIEELASKIERGEISLSEIKSYVSKLKREVKEYRIPYQTLAELYPLVNPERLLEERVRVLYPPPTGEIAYAGELIEDIPSALYHAVENCERWYGSDEASVLTCIAEEIEEFMKRKRKLDYTKLKKELEELYGALVEKGRERDLDKILQQIRRR